MRDSAFAVDEVRNNEKSRTVPKTKMADDFMIFLKQDFFFGIIKLFYNIVTRLFRRIH